MSITNTGVLQVWHVLCCLYTHLCAIWYLGGRNHTKLVIMDELEDVCIGTLILEIHELHQVLTNHQRELRLLLTVLTNHKQSA